MKINLKDIGLSFDAKRHIHYIRGVPVYGCTTVTGVFPKELVWWASGMACARFGWISPKKHSKADVLRVAQEKFEEIKKLDINGYIELLQTAYKAHKDAKETAGTHGTDAHELIEIYIKTGSTNTVEFASASQTALDIFDQFREWEKLHKIEWVASELQVGSEKHSFAGILDGLAVVDGKLSLIDFKTSSGIYPSYYAQLGGLSICLKEMLCPPIERRFILWLPKDGTRFEVVEPPTSMEQDEHAFLKALDFYRVIQGYKEATK